MGVMYARMCVNGGSSGCPLAHQVTIFGWWDRFHFWGFVIRFNVLDDWLRFNSLDGITGLSHLSYFSSYHILGDIYS